MDGLNLALLHERMGNYATTGRPSKRRLQRLQELQKLQELLVPTLGALKRAGTEAALLDRTLRIG